MKNLTTYLQGLIMGTAEAIPGISGSTLGLIMGIYDDFINLLHQISQVVKQIIKLLLRKGSPTELKEAFLEIDMRFAAWLIAGIASAILLFSHVVEFLFSTYPQYLSAFFFGLIAASINVPLAKVHPLKSKHYLILLSSFVIFYIFLGLNFNMSSGEPPLWLFFIGGILGISGMVLPGISGSFIMLLLGIYDDVFSILKNFTGLNFTTSELLQVTVFISGLAVGFLGFIRILKTALDRKYAELMSFIAGLMLASLRILWPYQQTITEFGETIKINLLPWQVSPRESLLLTTILVFTFLLSLLLTSRFRAAAELDKLKSEDSGKTKID